MEKQKTLYRSHSNSIIGGVSGGLGKYFSTDPVVFRILFVALTFLAAGGLLAYIILWIVMPVEPYYKREEPHFGDASAMNNEETGEAGNYPVHDFKKPKTDGSLIVGIILITLGGIFLIDRFIPRIDFGDIWPVILIVVGLIIIGTNLQTKNKY